VDSIKGPPIVTLVPGPHPVLNQSLVMVTG